MYHVHIAPPKIVIYTQHRREFPVLGENNPPPPPIKSSCMLFVTTACNATAFIQEEQLHVSVAHVVSVLLSDSTPSIFQARKRNPRLPARSSVLPLRPSGFLPRVNAKTRKAHAILR